MTKTNKTGATGRTRDQHPDHRDLLPRLNRTEGQLAGIKKMIEMRRYCPEIIQQLRATRKALASIEASLLETHLRQCLSDALKSKSAPKIDEKIVEIMRIFKSGEENGIKLKSSDEAEL